MMGQKASNLTIVLMTNDYVNHENMIMLIMVSDLLNDYVDYGK